MAIHEHGRFVGSECQRMEEITPLRRQSDEEEGA